MSARTGALLPTAQRNERRKFGRTTLFDYSSRSNISFAFEVYDTPIAVKLYGAINQQRVHVLSCYGTGDAEVTQQFSPDNEPAFLDAGRNSILLRTAGRYRLQLEGVPGTCIVTYEPQMTGRVEPEIPQPSGVQAQDGNLLLTNKRTDVIEIADIPWAFTAFGLVPGEYLELWTAYGWGGSYREELYLANSVPVRLTPTANSIKVDVSGRYLWKLVGDLDNIVLTGNPTGYAETVGSGTGGTPGPEGPPGAPGQGIEWITVTTDVQYAVNNTGYLVEANAGTRTVYIPDNVPQGFNIAINADGGHVRIDPGNNIIDGLPAGNTLLMDDGNTANLVARRPGLVEILFASLAPPPANESVNFYQQTPQTVWTIAHNQGRRPPVTVTTVGGVVIWAEVIYLSDNVLQVIFDTPTAGYAYI